MRISGSLASLMLVATAVVAQTPKRAQTARDSVFDRCTYVYGRDVAKLRECLVLRAGWTPALAERRIAVFIRQQDSLRVESKLKFDRTMRQLEGYWDGRGQKGTPGFSGGAKAAHGRTSAGLALRAIPTCGRRSQGTGGADPRHLCPARAGGVGGALGG
jgi:hypothetical protein